MKWILVILLFSPYSPATTTQAFTTKEACISAVDWLNKTGETHRTKVHAVCIEDKI